MPTKPVRSRRRVWIVVAAVVVLAVAATVFATARSSAEPDYRTAKAAPGDVKVTLDVTGTIQPVDRADLTFPVAGGVSAVPVVLGQHVTAGTVLAQLDTTALDAQVASAASQLATAKAKLAADRSGQGSSAGAGASAGVDAAAASAARAGSSGGNAAAGTAAAGNAAAGAAAAAAGNAAPDAAVAGAGPANAGSRSAGPANASPADAGRGGPAATSAPAEAAAGSPAAPTAATVGAGPGNGGVVDAGPSGTAAASPAPVNTAPGAAAAAPGTAPGGAKPPAVGPAQQALQQATDALAKARDARAEHQQAAESALATVQHDLDAATPACEPTGDPTACQIALRKVLDGQTEVATLQKQVATDNKALDAGIAVLLQAAAKLASAVTAIPTVPPVASPVASPVPGPAPAQPVAAAAAPVPAPSVRSATPTGGTVRAAAPVSAEQLAADQAAIDAAAAQLITAQQNRDQSTLTSPIDGTIGALTLQPGQKVSGAGAAQVVVVGAARGYQVQATVGEADVARLAAGNTVAVVPDGAAAPIEGTVTTIGILPNSATTGAVSYPVTIALPAGSGPFPAGQGAAVAIQVADVAGVLTVPTSAVHTTGAVRTVEVIRGGRAVPLEVQVGAVGATRTEITSGLVAGDVVVLADPSRPLPTTGGLSGLSRIGGR